MQISLFSNKVKNRRLTLSLRSIFILFIIIEVFQEEYLISEYLESSCLSRFPGG